VNAGLTAGRVGARVQARSGAQRRAPATTGSMQYESLGAAPGRYVREK